MGGRLGGGKLGVRGCSEGASWLQRGFLPAGGAGSARPVCSLLELHGRGVGGKLSGISLVGDVAVAVMTASGMALTGEHTCAWLTVLSLPAGRCFPAQHWCACAGPRRAWRWWAQPGCGLAGCQAPGICMPQHWAVIRS